MSKQTLYPTTKEHLQDVAEQILAMAELDIPEFGFVIEIKTGTLTTKQRAALHVYCRLLGQALNDAGLDMRRVLKDDIDIPWSLDSVKEHLWRPIQKVAVGKISTNDLERDEVSKVHQVLDRFTGERFGIHVPFPQNRYPE